MTRLYNIKSILILAAVTAAAFVSAPVWAQGLNNNAWAPQPANRASIAALIRQVEQGDMSRNSGVLGYAGSSVTQLICGANSDEGTGASANAQANSSCIILNNSDGTLNIDQDSDGEQSADLNSTETTSIDEMINEPGSVDDILMTLAGEQ